MTLNELRMRILSEHVQLREALETTLEKVQRAGARRSGVLPPAPRREVQFLVEVLLTHIELEDRELVPVLQEIDAWGEERARRVKVEHEAHRAALRKLSQLAQSATGPELLEAAEGLFKSLLIDMAEEDRTVLHPDLLRDDVVSIGQTDG